MTLAAMALFADATSRLMNIASWRVKETDRIAAMATECARLGAAVRAGDDWLEVTPPRPWRPAAIRTYDDHRIAMCFSLAAFGGVPVRILDPRCVGKTFPDYFEALFAVVEADPPAVPVITVDGPTASGKGTLAGAGRRARLPRARLRRAVPRHRARRAAPRVDPDDEPNLARLAAALPLRFERGRALLADEDVTDALRDEAVGQRASRVSALAGVRRALHGLQLSFRRAPGLVADGRDMGTVIFPDAPLKVFLTASAAERAERRSQAIDFEGTFG